VEATERDLVAGLRRGEPAAFDAAYEAWRARVHAFLLRLGRDEAEAEDLLQETWLRLARSAPRLAPDTDLGAWLFSVARNLQASRARFRLLRGRGWRARLGLGGGIEPVTPFDHAAAGQTARRLEAALGRLPVREREALLLVSVDRLEPAQAARALGLTPEALRQRLARGRASLRAALEPEGGAAPPPGGAAARLEEDPT